MKKFHKRNASKYSRGNYNILQVQNARECASASASDPFAVVSTFEGTRVFSREECVACQSGSRAGMA